MNKKYLYSIIAILLIIIVCLLTYKTSEALVFKGDKENTIVHSFGILNKNKTRLYEHTFKYVNKKYDTLKVYGVKDGCDCTESDVKVKLYLKNDTIAIKTIYNPKKYKDSGAIVKQIFLITNKVVSKYDTIYPLALKGILK